MRIFLNAVPQSKESEHYPLGSGNFFGKHLHQKRGQGEGKEPALSSITLSLRELLLCSLAFLVSL